MGSKRELKEQLREDSTFQQYRRIVSTIEGRVTITKFVIEARSLHGARTMRTLKGTAPSSDKVYDAIVRDAATRSRLVEMEIALLVERDLLKSAMAAVSAHLQSSYDLGELARTLTDKRTLIKKILKRGHSLLDEMESAKDALDLIIKDIDQAGFAARNMVEIIKLRVERPAHVV